MNKTYGVRFLVLVKSTERNDKPVLNIVLIYIPITRLIVLCKNDLKAYAGTAAVKDNISYIFYNKP